MIRNIYENTVYRITCGLITGVNNNRTRLVKMNELYENFAIIFSKLHLYNYSYSKNRDRHVPIVIFREYVPSVLFSFFKIINNSIDFQLRQSSNRF